MTNDIKNKKKISKPQYIELQLVECVEWLEWDRQFLDKLFTNRCLPTKSLYRVAERDYSNQSSK